MIVKELEEFGVEVIVQDPLADREDVWDYYRINLVDKEEVKKVHCVVLAVNHNEFKGKYELSLFEQTYVDNNRLLIDIKGMYNRKEVESKGYVYWRL